MQDVSKLYVTMHTIHIQMSFTIRINANTAQTMKEMSIVHDADGKPIEPYDSIIRRAITALKAQQQIKKIDITRM